jgi:hypothetical protein
MSNPKTASRAQLTSVYMELAKAMMNYGKTLDDLKQRVEELERRVDRHSDSLGDIETSRACDELLRS